MRLIKSKLEFETEIYNEDIAIIAERLVTKYTGNAVLRAGTEKVMKDKVTVDESWLVIYTVDEQQFQEFLHSEFLKLIPVLEVVKDGMVNTLSWPTEGTPEVLKSIIVLDSTPAV